MQWFLKVTIKMQRVKMMSPPEIESMSLAWIERQRLNHQATETGY